MPKAYTPLSDEELVELEKTSSWMQRDWDSAAIRLVGEGLERALLEIREHRLSDEDRQQLVWIRTEIVAWGQGIPVTVIDRLLGGPR